MRPRRFSRQQVDAVDEDLADLEEEFYDELESCDCGCCDDEDDDDDGLIQTAAQAGYDISGMRPLIESLASRGR